MSEELKGQVAALSIMIQLQRKAREAADERELGFVMVNETHHFLQYRQAALWQKGRGVVAVSGLPDIDRNSPYVQWLVRLFREMSKFQGMQVHTSQSVPEALAVDWNTWLPAYCLGIPLKNAARNGEVIGFLMLAREMPWHENDQALAEELSGMYAHAWSALLKRQLSRNVLGRLFKQRPFKLILALGLMAILSLPIRLSVLVPAEVEARNPVLVRAPISGVVDHFHIEPNENVNKEQLLFDLDPTTLRNQLEIAQKTYQVAEAEYRRAAQMAVFNENGKMEIAIRKGRLKEKAAEVNHVSELLERVKVKAPREGVAVFADTYNWQGRAVTVGERVLTIADPNHVELAIELPVGDAIPLRKGMDVKFFLNISPNNPLDGTLSYLSYRAEPTVEGVLSYRLKSQFKTKGPLPRIGLTGTAKLYGEKVPLAYYLLRRPIAATRQWLGV